MTTSPPQEYVLPVGAPTIAEWGTRRCSACRRDRVHYRKGSTWRCIGTLPERVSSAPCGDAR